MENIPQHRRWMYKRLSKKTRELRLEFVIGVQEFVDFCMLQPTYVNEQTIRCPCKVCESQTLLSADDVKLHLYKNGFKPFYAYWVANGEIDPYLDTHVGPSTRDIRPEVEREDGDGLEDMVYDAMGTDYEQQYRANPEEPPNAEARKFFKMLDAAKKPLWEGSDRAPSQLQVAVSLLTTKGKHNCSVALMNDVVKMLNDFSFDNHRLPNDFKAAKRIVSNLGLSSTKIDCCIKGCMIFYGEDANLDKCKWCNEDRYTFGVSGARLSRKVMHYLPLIPRLKRLYQSMASSPHM